MATTTNIGLTKPAGTDKALVSVINSNSDIIDSAAGGLMDAIAIVANGNTHAAISAGQYVYVHNHGTLAEGLYTANSAIAANATLTTSNLTADASGGLNALKSNTTGTCTSTYGTITYVRQANVVTITGSCSGMANNSWVTLCSNAPKCVKAIKFVAFDSSGTKNVSMNIENTSVQFYGRNESTSCAFGATYITE